MQKQQKKNKTSFAGNEISIEEFIEEACNLCRVDAKIREIKDGSHTVCALDEVNGRDDQESATD